MALMASGTENLEGGPRRDSIIVAGREPKILAYHGRNMVLKMGVTFDQLKTGGE